MLLITIVYVIVQIMNYELISVETIKPVYQAEQSIYFCDPGTGDQLIRMSENGKEIILREKICNYCLEGDMLLYSTEVDLYACNADGEEKSDLSESNYGNFFIKDNLFFFTYEYTRKNEKTVWYCVYDKSMDTTEILDKRSFDAEKALMVASFYRKDNVLWDNRQFCFFYYGSSIFRLDF